MRIGIECTTLTRPRAGIGFYNYHLLNELASLEDVDELFAFYNRPLPEMPLSNRILHVLRGPSSSTHVWCQTRLGGLCRQYGIDVLHSPGQCLPFLYENRRVLTIHDLSAMHYPRHKDLKSRLVWNCLVPNMAQRADKIITVSDNTRQDVIENLGIEEERVHTIYEAAAPEFYPEPDEERIHAFRRNKHLEPGYILAVGTLEPRKNYPFLLRAFAHWLEKSKVEATLVIVGKPGWLYNEIFETLESLNIQRHVRIEGYVPDMDLMRTYYSGAAFTVMAPWYEGFWLPGLESLACGTPVIAPNHSSIPEVIGDAGILLDDYHEEEWVAAMDQMWNSTNRDEWAAKGIEQANRFSWKDTAKETLKIYQSLMDGAAE